MHAGDVLIAELYQLLHSFSIRASFWWRKVFAVSEIEENPSLIWSFGATLVCYLLVFGNLFYDTSATRDAFLSGTHVCWPYFQSCGELMMLHALPQGYSQGVLYMGMYAVLLFSAFALAEKRFMLAHISLSVVWAWHFFATFFLSYPSHPNHMFYLFTFGTILLFFPHKEFFLKAAIVLLYFLSATIKIHPSWIAGTYFSALVGGLPLAPDIIMPVVTNIAIASQIVLPWFLFSRQNVLRVGALVFYTVFHLYSIILVGYTYPTLVLLLELLLFGKFFRPQAIPFDARAIAGWAFLALWCIVQSIAYIIPGDSKLTEEGNRFGLHMFDANHQCVSTEEVIYLDGTSSVSTSTHSSIRNRCEVYRQWFLLQTRCSRDSRIDRIRWNFDHSLNGGPFLRIVNEENACALTFDVFRHNPWIRTEKDGPEVVGYPVTNFYIR